MVSVLTGLARCEVTHLAWLIGWSQPRRQPQLPLLLAVSNHDAWTGRKERALLLVPSRIGPRVPEVTAQRRVDDRFGTAVPIALAVLTGNLAASSYEPIVRMVGLITTTAGMSICLAVTPLGDTSQGRMFIMARSRPEFTPDYKDEAVKLVVTTGLAATTVARELRDNRAFLDKASIFFA